MICQIISRGTPKKVDTKRPRPSFSRIDNFTQEIIKRQIYSMYAENNVPTVTSLFLKLKQDYVEFPYSETTLFRLIRKMGYKYSTLNQRHAIMESPRLIKCRMEYVRAIKNFRLEGKNIIFLDETWYDTHDLKKKGFADQSSKCFLNAPCSRGQRIIILHAGSKNGWIPGALLLSAKNIKNSCADYHEDMTADLFETWFKDQLIPNLPSNSVIVMDNASYHSRQIKKIPRKNTRKDEIFEFLISNCVPMPPKSFTIPKLLDIVATLNCEKSYVVDTFAKEHGHQVLRLPPYYCIFNPIELIWSELKNKIRKANATPNLNNVVVQLVRNTVDLIGVDSWRNCDRHVIEIENKYVPLSTANPIIINLQAESSSDSEMEDSD